MDHLGKLSWVTDQALMRERLVVFVRHAESEKNVLDFHGHNTNIDYPLTEDGKMHAENFASRLFTIISVRNVVTSASRSPYQTAEAICRKYEITPFVRSELRAVNMGIIAELADDDVARLYPNLHAELSLFKKGLLHPSKLTIPGRETYESFSGRLISELLFIASLPGPVVVVAHQSALNQMLHLIRTWSSNHQTATFFKQKLPNLAAVIVDAQTKSPDGWNILGLLQAPHPLPRVP